MAEINFKCEECDFSFLDKNLIFYLDTDLDDLESILNFYSKDENGNANHLELIETSLNKESSDKMTKSLIAGFLYENYCLNPIIKYCFLILIRHSIKIGGTFLKTTSVQTAIMKCLW